MSVVLVTGGSGFIGIHCIQQLLAAGHQVRATVRSLNRTADIHAMLTVGGVDPGDRLTVLAADLTVDDGWVDAVRGCDYVLHVASPFPLQPPDHDDEVIVPARAGALRVLHAARDAGVKRVVLTSSVAAVGYGHAPRESPFHEADWTDLSAPKLSAYVKSKTLAERAAWDFMAASGGSLELAVVNPVLVMGPVLGADYSTSIVLIRRMLEGKVPACPRLSFGVVDVRDVADLHLRAMTHPRAKGERLLAVAGEALSILDIARIVRRRLGQWGRKAPTRELPNWLVRVAALADPALRQIVPELGTVKRATSAKAQRLLGWEPRSPEEAIVATGESLVKLGLIR